MTLNKLLITAASMIILFGCAHRQKNDSDQTSSTPAASSSSQASSDSKAAPPKPEERKDVRKVTVNGVDGEIWGTPAPGSKFSKIQIGMNQEQVEKMIGRADNFGGVHPTGNSFRPFYYGGDTRRVEVSYRNEGQLTYTNNSHFSAPDTLIVITVDRKETGK